jgi:medium-chain acyl-[acyl-carrier-protein] hydrolase
VDDGPWDAAYSTTVRYTDIDVNRHVTSSRYIGWMLDGYPMEFHFDHEVQALEVNYLGETLAGDVLDVRTRPLGPAVRGHSLVKEGGAEVCRARIEWRERRASHLAKRAGLS